MVISVDVGGTKTLIKKFDAKGSELYSEKYLTPPLYSDFLIKLKNILLTLDPSECDCIIALPAKINRSNGVAIAFGNLPWKNIDLIKDLKDVKFKSLYIENDTKLAALHAAKSVENRYSRVLYVTISTGIGTALVINQELDESVIDSELGHMKLEHNGRTVEWERFASGSAIINKYGKLASEITSKLAWKEIAHNIGLGLGIAVAAYSPDCIMLGGGVSTNFSKFIGYLEEEIGNLSGSMLSKPVILQTPNPEEAVTLGGLLYIYAQRRIR